MTGSQPVDAVTFHSGIADRFSSRYDESRAFRDRKDVWSEAIESVGSRKFALDLGCGAGQITELLQASTTRIVAIDGSAEMIKLCRDRTGGQAEYRCARLESLDLSEFADADLVVASSVLEYLDEPVDLVRRVADAVGPGAVCLATIQNRRSVYRFAERFAFRLVRRPGYLVHVRSRPRPADLAVAGFEIRSTRPLSPAPGIGQLARKLGLRRWCDTLILVELVRGGRVGSS